MPESAPLREVDALPARKSDASSVDAARVRARVLTLIDIGIGAARAVLAQRGLELIHIATEDTIPGSFWGAPEAGVIGHRVYARDDTPVHSLLHEACHLIVVPEEKRVHIHTDASDSQAEEDAACYLQILLADELAGVGRDRLMQDMDMWGYSFRLGSARAWFESDAEDAWRWLRERELLAPPRRDQM